MHSYPHLINGAPECYVNLKFNFPGNTAIPSKHVNATYFLHFTIFIISPHNS